MLKELEKIIGGMRFSIMGGAGYRYSDSEIAQAIIDRLEIDEDKIYLLLWDDGIIPSGVDSEECWELAKTIAKTKPIKLKESDK